MQRFVDQVMNAGWLELIDEPYGWLRHGRTELGGAIPRLVSDVHMEIVQLVAEGERVWRAFVCSATHLGRWGGHEPARRRFKVDEVYFFELAGGRIAKAWASRTRGGASVRRADDEISRPAGPAAPAAVSAGKLHN